MMAYCNLSLLAFPWQIITQMVTVLGHYTGVPVLAGTSVKNWRTLLEQDAVANGNK